MNDWKQAEKRNLPAGYLSDTYRPGPLRANAQITTEHQRLKYNILRVNSGKRMKALLFSSSNRGEGTSTIVINFAMSLAADGESVLLVDGNLRNPSLHAAFGLEKDNGLTDLLLGKEALAETIKETNLGNLSVITSGNFHPNPFVIFESGLLPSQVEAMKAGNDWVLFDSPPICPFNDAGAIAAHVDGVILVVEAEKTRWEVGENARKWIEGGNGTVLGVVLNKRRYHIPAWIYRKL